MSIAPAHQRRRGRAGEPAGQRPDQRGGRPGLLSAEHKDPRATFPRGAELLFEVISQRYERGSIIITSNLPFDEWTEVFRSERLTGAILDRLTVTRDSLDHAVRLTASPGRIEQDQFAHARHAVVSGDHAHET